MHTDMTDKQFLLWLSLKLNITPEERKRLKEISERMTMRIEKTVCAIS